MVVMVEETLMGGKRESLSNIRGEEVTQRPRDGRLKLWVFCQDKYWLTISV